MQRTLQADNSRNAYLTDKEIKELLRLFLRFYLSSFSKLL